MCKFGGVSLIRSYLYTELEDWSDSEGGLQMLWIPRVWSVKWPSPVSDAGRAPTKNIFIQPLYNVYTQPQIENTINYKEELKMFNVETCKIF